MRKKNVCSVEEAMLAMAREHKLTYDPDGSNKDLLVNTENNLVNFHINDNKKIDTEILYPAAFHTEDANDIEIQASRKTSLNKEFKTFETIYDHPRKIPLKVVKSSKAASYAVKRSKRNTRKQIKANFNHMEFKKSESQ